MMGSGGQHQSDSITWTVEAADNCGNVEQSTCTVNVVNEGMTKQDKGPAYRAFVV